jgi:membrane fusion protein (multidrug efflux system)
MYQMLNKNTLSRAIIPIAVMLLIIAAGCQKKEKPRVLKLVNVRISTVQSKTVKPNISTVGSLKPLHDVVISPEVDGIVTSLFIEDGKYVKKGDVLAVINETDYALDLKRAEAALRQAEAILSNTKVEYGRKQTLLKEELVTKQQFDDVSTRMVIAENDLGKAKATLDLAKQRLNKTRILSPVTGAVKDKKISTGAFARASVPICSIIVVNPLKLVFTVGEKDVSRIKAGQEVAFNVDAYPSREFKAKVSSIFSSLDDRTRALTVEALAQNDDNVLKAGFFAQVKLFTDAEKKALLIPSTAIVYDESKTRVFVLEDDIAKEKQVSTGDTYGDMIEVTSGLTAGERIVVVGQNNLADGVKVNILK